LHNISEDKIFYFGEKPWHGIGTELNHPATSREAIIAAKLNYSVIKTPVYTELTGRQEVPNAYATVNMSNNAVLGVVSDKYRIIQNEDAFDFFDSIVGGGKAIYHTAGALGQGERIWILAKLPGDIRVTNEDNVEKYLLLTNSHDGKNALRMYFTPVRVVCQNTLIMSLGQRSEEGIVIRHVGSVQDKVEEAARLLGISNDFYNTLGEKFNRFLNIKMDKNGLRHYYVKVVYNTDAEAVKTPVMENRISRMTELFETGKGNDRPEVRGTLWSALNSVTEYVDHYRSHKDTNDDKLKNVWFGQGAKIKNRAFEVATSMTSIKPVSYK